MTKVKLVACVFLLSSLAVLGDALAATPPSSHPTLLSQHDARTDAVLVRNGNVSAMHALARDMFARSGVSPDVADAFGFSDRVVAAESTYRSEHTQAIPAQRLVTSINRFADALGAASWAHTSPAEITRLRMHLLATNPELFGDHSGKEQGRALSPTLSPLEASYVATALLYQKLFNSDYQLTDAEYASRGSLTDEQRATRHFERERDLLGVVRGTTGNASMADVVSAADQLFTELGIPAQSPTAESSASAPLPKGVRQ